MKPQDLVTSWLRGGRAAVSAEGLSLAARSDGALLAKLRRAYDWIAREAIVSPYHDIEFGERTAVGRGGAGAQRIDLHRTSYSSYILLPLLNLATSQRLLFVGAPGRDQSCLSCRRRAQVILGQGVAAAGCGTRAAVLSYGESKPVSVLGTLRRRTKRFASGRSC
jgi:hypothetical protein